MKGDLRRGHPVVRDEDSTDHPLAAARFDEIRERVRFRSSDLMPATTPEAIQRKNDKHNFQKQVQRSKAFLKKPQVKKAIHMARLQERRRCQAELEKKNAALASFSIS